jgi:hypothetical protein
MDIYRDKQSDADIEASTLAGIRRNTVLIHPHYYALAQLFCEMLPIQDHVFGTPEGKIVTHLSVEEGVDGTAQHARKISDDGPFNEDPFTDTVPAGEARSEEIDQDDDGAGIFCDSCIFGDEPQSAEIPSGSRKRGSPVTLITIGGGSGESGPYTEDETAESADEPNELRVASEIDDENEDAARVETGKPDADSLPLLEQELATAVDALHRGNPAAAAREARTHAVTQVQSGNLQNENTDNTETVPVVVSEEEVAAQEMEDKEATAVQRQEERSAMQEQQEHIAEYHNVAADISCSPGEISPDDEKYLDADGMPTLKLAKAMIPLFVKNYLLQILPSQQKADHCALFVAKNGKMYMGRDMYFGYLWKYAKKDGILPQDAKIRPGVYNRLTKYWLELNYLEKTKSSNPSSTYTRLNLFDLEKGEWITESVTLDIPYLVNFRNISKEISLKTIPEIVHFADKTFEQLVDDIIKVRYKSSIAG